MKKASFWCLIFVFFFLFSSCFVLDVQAATKKCPLCAKQHDYSELSSLEAVAIEWRETVYGGSIFSEDTLAILKFDRSSSSFRNIWNKGEEYYGALVWVSSLLACVYIFYDLFTKASADNLSPEGIFKSFTRLIIGLIIIKNGFTIITTIIDVGSLAVSQLAPGGNPENAMSEFCKFNEAVFQWTFFDCMIDMSTTFIPWLILSGAGAFFSITVWTRVLNILIRMIFSPLAIADIMNDGVHSSGMKYLKRLFGVVLQGGVALALCNAYGLAVGIAQSKGGMDAWFIPIMLAFVLMGALPKASAIAGDIVG